MPCELGAASLDLTGVDPDPDVDADLAEGRVRGSRRRIGWRGRGRREVARPPSPVKLVVLVTRGTAAS